MKIYWRFGAIVTFVMVLGFSTFAAEHSEKAEGAGLRRETLIDADWRFHSGEVAANNQVIAKNFDDTPWQRVQLPHDYGLDGKYEPTNPRQRGYLPIDV